MPHEWEGNKEAQVDATPEEVWEAIATGPGIDSWFMGRNEVQPGEHGSVLTVFGDYVQDSAVTAWEPLKRFAYHSGKAPDGRFIAYEFLIEGRDQGGTVLRLVANGFLPGDNWEDEYDAMVKGGEMYFRTLVAYLTHFRGRTAVPVTAFGPPVADWDQALSTLNASLGLAEPVSVGDPVHAAPEGLAPIDGVVDYATPETLGIRTADGLYRFIRGIQGVLIVGHHLFADVDREQAERDWQTWLARTFA